MLVGHYGVAFALKATDTRISLGALFTAVILPDVLLFIFFLAGIESFTIEMKKTHSVPFEYQQIAYSHGLLYTATLSIAVLLLARFAFRKDSRYSVLVALGVFSHWILDAIMHKPVLPLSGPDSATAGLGLTNIPVALFMLEIALLAGGAWLYARQTRPKIIEGKTGLLFMLLVMVAMEIVNAFGPPMASSEYAISIIALGTYGMFTCVAFWLDSLRK